MYKNKKTTKTFQSEVKELLHLMIHSLYSNKEIFLREVISNASDAIEKLRFEKIKNSEKYQNTQQKPSIKITLNKKEKTIEIEDNGIGMLYEEVIKNIGTIAKSGTKEFIKSFKKKEEKNEFIGKFGVGFYSTFIVADKVSIYTKHASQKNDAGVLWESDGLGEYTIQEIKKKTYGTKIVLLMKEKELQFLEDWNIQQIIKKYSDHIITPIELLTYNEKEKTHTWKKINQAQSIWTRNKKNIKDEEYYQFYSYLTNDSEKPLIWSHNIIEGNLTYTNLLYIPKKSTWNIWDRENKKGLKLYVQNVFIMDDAEQFLPNYLRFVKGIIDSQNLPLNISREILQNNYITQNLKKALTKKVLKLLEDLKEKQKEKYKTFWKNFGSILKEGVAEDIENQKEILNLLKFSTLIENKKEQNISLKKYIKKMSEKQDKIYYLTAENYKSAINSPYLEIFRENNIDVLILYDRIDEWMMNYVTEFEGKKFQSIRKSNSTIDKIFKKSKKKCNNPLKNSEKIIEIFKKHLKNKIKDAKITNRLKNSPVMVVTDTNDMSTQMAELLKSAGQSAPEIKYILEINPNHKLIINLEKIEDKKILKIWIDVLFCQAILSEKGSLENPNNFIKKINYLLNNKN